jgi:hypothetical protein
MKMPSHPGSAAGLMGVRGAARAEPFEFTLGDGNVLELLELAVAGMMVRQRLPRPCCRPRSILGRSAFSSDDHVPLTAAQPQSAPQVGEVAELDVRGRYAAEAVNVRRHTACTRSHPGAMPGLVGASWASASGPADG